MNICGQEFNFSALNADDIERMERAQKHFDEAAAREESRTKASIADTLRGQCRLLMDFLDEILGEGASARLGLNGSDFGACKRVMNEITQAVKDEQRVLASTPVPMNREQRRAAEKRKHKPPVGYPAQPASHVMLDYDVPAVQMVERVDKATRRKQLLDELAALDDGDTVTQEDTFIRGQSEVSYSGAPAVPPALTDRQKTDQLIDARQAVNSMRDDPEALQQLAAYALKVAAERHV